MRKLTAIAITWATLSLPAFAFDAGGFALQQHQHQLLQQQTAPNNFEEPDSVGAGAETYDSLRTRYMNQLRPEYELRVRRDGLEAANRWLKEEAGRLGREAARILQSQ
jgi:hypothetical protein